MKTQKVGKNISFYGIFNIRYPQGPKTKRIPADCSLLNDLLKKNWSADFKIAQVDNLDVYENLSPKGIQVTSKAEEPFFIARIFKKIDERMCNAFMNKNNKSNTETVIDILPN